MTSISSFDQEKTILLNSNIKLIFKKYELLLSLPVYRIKWSRGPNYGSSIHIALIHELLAVNILGEDMVKEYFNSWFQELINEGIIVTSEMIRDKELIECISLYQCV